jgi:uncharacterized metal-binding protein YceD (DUF177 family)
MRVRISDLRPEGILIKDTISLESLNERMNVGDENDVIFLEEPQVALKIKSVGSTAAEAIGLIKAKYKQSCGMCAEDVTLAMEIDAHFMLKQKLGIDQPEIEYEDDRGVVTYEGEHVELEDIIQESLILKVTPYYVPERDENGVCSLCNKCPAKEANILEDAPEEKESTVLFGELLAKAQRKNKKKS